jgi:ribonuclease HI
MKSVTVVCDGSALGNGQKAARAAAAAVLTFADGAGRVFRRVVGEYLGEATNNQAEIVAACIALEALREPCSVRLVTDSRYVVETLKGNFRRKMNHDFWARLDRAAAPHRVTWEWTRGHAGHAEQELCDKLARRIAATGTVDPDELAAAVAAEPLA